MNRHAILATEYFKEGYNCAQAVIKAYADEFEVDESKLLKMASSFGGGMGRCRLTCGAFSAICLVLGNKFGYDAPDDISKKQDLYFHIQNVYNEFLKCFNTVNCKELLNIKDDTISYVPTPRDENFYKTRPCLNIIATSCEILDEYLRKIEQ